MPESASFFVPVEATPQIPNVYVDPVSGLLARATAFSSASAVPTTGSYTQGDFVWNTAPAISNGQLILGWSRLTTGSGHVVGVDWAVIYVSTAPTYLPQSLALFARMSPAPSPARKTIINQFISTLVDAGIWAKLDCLYMLATTDINSAKLNWISTSNPLVALGTGGTFTKNLGFNGGGTAAFNTGFIPGTGLTLRDDHSVTVQIADNVALGVGAIGNDQLSINARSNTDAFATRSASTSVNSSANTDSRGSWAISRSSGTGYSRYHNGTLVDTPVQASSAFSGLYSMYLCGRNNAGTTTYNTQTVSFASIGAALTGTQETVLNQAIADYLVALAEL